MARHKNQPRVTIRHRDEQRVRVEFAFADGKGGLIEFFYAVFGDNGPTQGCVDLYRFDGGIRVNPPNNLTPSGITEEPKP